MVRRQFSREFKLEAVRLVKERGALVVQASRALDVGKSMLRRWIKELTSDPGQAFPGQGQLKPEQQEIDRLRREVAKLKAERDIQNKPRPISRGSRYEVRLHYETSRDLAGAAALRGAGCLAQWLPRLAHPVAQCWCTQRQGSRRAGQVQLRRQRPDYGARRVWHDVLAEGAACGLHRVERLMREQALRARPRRRGLPSDKAIRDEAADNVLDRQFMATAPNQKWIADLTYIWTTEGWLYVAAVIDLFSRRVVGWSMSATMAAQLVADALMMATWSRGKPDALLHHSDQGSQYSSEQFQKLLADHDVSCSMSRSGNVWDNAAMESFFSSLKTKRTARKVYRTRDQARADVFDYIERFYNPPRRHSTIGYLSPMEFERSKASA